VLAVLSRLPGSWYDTTTKGSLNMCSPPPAPLLSQETTQTESVTQFGFQFLAPPPIQQDIAIRGTLSRQCPRQEPFGAHSYHIFLSLLVHADRQFIGVDGRPVQLKGINW
jgi:hypothetical protein